MNRLARLMYIYSGCIFFPHVIADRQCIDRKALISGLLIRAHTVDRYITYSTSSTTSYMSILKSYTANIWLFFYSFLLKSSCCCMFEYVSAVNVLVFFYVFSVLLVTFWLRRTNNKTNIMNFDKHIF